jgi:DNA-binding response OmpR family regulator
MVVDDDPEACDAFDQAPRFAGSNRFRGDLGASRPWKLDGVPYDAIVADVGMPVDDGFYFAREVRNREQDGGMNGRVLLVALTDLWSRRRQD